MGIRAREGNWHYRFEVHGREYSGNTDLAATERNRSAALRAEAKARDLVLQGRERELHTEIIPFSEAAESFLRWADSEHREHPNTAKRLRTSFASLSEFFGNKPVLSITAGMVEDFKAWRRNEHKVAEVTLRHDLHALSPFFVYAKKHNWARINPVRDVEMPSDADAVRMHVLTPAEEMAYFGAAVRWPNLRDVSRIIRLQGLRPEEVMELRKDCVDLVAGTLTVLSGKTKAARRTLILTSEAKSILAARVAETGVSGWLFPSPKRRGQPLAKLNGVHDRAIEAINPCVACGRTESAHGPRAKCTGYVEPVPAMRFVLYDLRHTCATRWVEAGVDLPTVAKWLGHSNLRSVHKYVHPTPEHDVAMAKRNAEYMAQHPTGAESTGAKQPRHPDENRTITIPTTVQ